MRRFAVVVVLFIAVTVTLAAQAPRPVLKPGNTVLIASYACASDQLSRADAHHGVEHAEVVGEPRLS